MPLTITVTRRATVVGVVAVAALTTAFTVGTAFGGSPSAEPVAFAAGTPAPAPASSGITVTGQGTVTGAPNVLTVGFSVNVVRPDTSSALADMGGIVGKVRDSLRANAITDADVTTSWLSLNPDYQYSSGRESIGGYAATESLTVKMRDLGHAGAAISAASSAGGNALTVGGFSFDPRDDAALLSAARAAAFADAKAKASQYASAAGRGLGAATSISETVDTPNPLPAEKGAVASGAPAVPIDPGTSQVSVTVTVVFALG
jgi:uncharacterized protein YggE